MELRCRIYLSPHLGPRILKICPKFGLKSLNYIKQHGRIYRSNKVLGDAINDEFLAFLNCHAYATGCYLWALETDIQNNIRNGKKVFFWWDQWGSRLCIKIASFPICLVSNKMGFQIFGISASEGGFIIRFDGGTDLESYHKLEGNFHDGYHEIVKQDFWGALLDDIYDWHQRVPCSWRVN